MRDPRSVRAIRIGAGAGSIRSGNCVLPTIGSIDRNDSDVPVANSCRAHHPATVESSPAMTVRFVNWLEFLSMTNELRDYSARWLN